MSTVRPTWSTDLLDRPARPICSTDLLDRMELDGMGLDRMGLDGMGLDGMGLEAPLTSGVLTSGPAFFPGWVSILFSAGLALGTARHLRCAVARAGEGNRWLHAGHAATGLSMIFMYLSMSFGWDWLPARWQMWFFAAASLAAAGYLAVTAARRRVVDAPWILLLIHLVAMVYMWYPPARWNSVLVFVLVAWFAAEAVGWVIGAFPFRDDRALMAVMAVSMGYMFFGMQLPALAGDPEQPQRPEHSTHSTHSGHSKH